MWRSLGFRLAFYYGTLVTITMVATISIVYLQTVGVYYHRMAIQVAGTSQKLATVFERGGSAHLTQEIDQSLSDDQNTALEILLYVDKRGNKLAGNLDKVPEKGSSENGQVVRNGVVISAYYVSQPLSDGGLLFVGSDLRDQTEIESLVTNSIVIACSFAVLLLLGGFFLFRIELSRSVEFIRRTLLRVASGEIKERVAPLGQDDEFALLGNDINNMLDQIEELMGGVKHVSDTIAHNLRTPLTRILFRIRSAKDEFGKNVSHNIQVEGIVQDLEGLITVIEKLLEMAEAESGARRIDFTPVVLSEVIHEVVDFYEVVAEAQGAQLRFADADHAVVSGDPNLLAGAIANLVDNALKYGGLNTRVFIELATTPDWVRVSVMDNGPGVSDDLLDRLGQRFFRIDRSILGHGLGLASVLAVAKLHNGKIRVEHGNPGLVVHLDIPKRGSRVSR